MNDHHTIALDKALSWVFENFKPIGIIVTGSIVRGNPDINSDFDIYVIHKEFFRQRIQKFFNNVPCEIFVNNINNVYGYFEKEHKNNRPVSAHMISTGKVVFGADNFEVKELINKANSFYLKPLIPTEIKLISLKYAISTLFEDATDIKDKDTLTCTYFLNKLINDIIDFIFFTNSIPLPRPKERIKYLEKNFNDIGKLIVGYYQTEKFQDKYEIAKIIVGKTVGEYGFFEWESDRD